MRIIPADYNAATPSGALRLGFRDSRRALSDAGARSGDWAWLNDGEVLVGARLGEDPDYGLVAIPRWETLVHLDDHEGADFPRVSEELQEALLRPGRGLEEEARVFRLLTIFTAIAPPGVLAVIPPGYLALRRAGALHFLGEPGLALIEIEEALRSRPGDPDILYFYLETLRRTDPDRALDESRSLADEPGASAPALAACINIWSAAAALSHGATSCPDSCFRNSAGVSLRNSPKLRSGSLRPSRP